MSNGIISIQNYVHNLINQGNSYASEGKLFESESILSKALKIARENKFYNEELQSSLTLSYCAQRKGDKKAAKSILNRCIELSDFLKDYTSKGKILLNHGVLILDEDSVKAIKYYENAYKLFKSTEDHQGMGQCLDNIGIAHSMLGSHRAAANYLHRAEKHLKLAGNTIELATNYQAQGDLLTEMANTGLEDPKATRQWAHKKYDKAIKLFEKSGAHLHAAICTDHIALLYKDEEKYEKAILLHKKAKKYFSKVRAYPLLSSVLLNMGTTYIAACKYEDALVSFKKAKEIKQLLQDSAGIARICNNEANILNTLGRYEEAIPLLRSSIESIDQLEAKITDEEMRSKFSEEHNKSWSEYFYSLLCLGIAKPKTNTVPLLVKAIEKSKSNLLNKHLSELPVATDNFDTDSFNNIQAEIEQRKLLSLASEQRVILRRKLKYGIIDRDRFENEIQKVINMGQKAFFVLQDLKQSRMFQVKRRLNPIDPIAFLSKRFNVNKKENNIIFLYIIDFPKREKILFCIISNKLVEYRSVDFMAKDRKDIYFQIWNLHGIKPVDQYDVDEKECVLKKLSYKLGNLLSQAGLFKTLKHQHPSSLVILPQGMLHLFPWEIANSSGTFLGIQYAIIRNYSVTLINFIHERLSTLPSFRGVSKANVYCPMLRELPGTAKEADRVESLLKQVGVDVCVVKDECATTNKFIEDCQVESLELIHFAGHSTLSQADPMLSSLVLNDNHTTALEIESKIRFTRSPFVCLSSCNSAVVQINNIDDAFGLVRAFLVSGARSLLLSNFFVLDSSASDFAETFYKHAIMKETSIEEALTTARKTISDRARECKYNEAGDLVHWAPYCLYGIPSTNLID
jgi:tetratricopeptide (TPR) repeat protein